MPKLKIWLDLERFRSGDGSFNANAVADAVRRATHEIEDRKTLRPGHMGQVRLPDRTVIGTWEVES